MFSIAGVAITKLMIVFVCVLEYLWAISDAGNIALNRTEVQSAVL
jgi:hypothetical protein